MDGDPVSRQPASIERALTPSMVEAVKAERWNSARLLLGIGIGAELFVLTLLFCASWRTPMTTERALATLVLALVPLVLIGATWLVAARWYRAVMRDGIWLRVTGPAQVEMISTAQSVRWRLETSAGTFSVGRLAEGAIPWATVDLIRTHSWFRATAIVLRIEDDRGATLYCRPSYRPPRREIPPD